jgi:hypothetical protein
MNPQAEQAGRVLLDRLAAQLAAALPISNAGYDGMVKVNALIPIERLPALAESVRTYIEAEAIYAQANQAQPQPHGETDS